MPASPVRSPMRGPMAMEVHPNVINVELEPTPDRIDDLDGNFCGKRFNKERMGWYVFDWSNSVFATLALAMVIPVFLAGLSETYAYHGHVSAKCHMPLFGENNTQSVICRDPTNPSGCTYPGKCECRYDSFGTGVWSEENSLFFGECHKCMLGAGTLEWFGPNLGNMNATGHHEPLNPWRRSENKATVPFMGFEVTPFSFTSMILSISVIMQAILFIAVGPFADYGNYRKRLLMLFSTAGAISCGAFLFVGHPSDYWIAGMFAIIANVCFGTSIVFYNSFLPLLADDHAEVKNTPEGEERDSVRDKIINAMSLNGFGAGYISGFFVVCIAFPFFYTLPNDAFSGRLADRVAMFIVCVWWLTFSVITAMWLKPRPGDKLPVEGACNKATFGFRRIWHVLKESRKYPNTFWFLVAFFFYSDGVSSVPSIGILFGQIYMCMSSFELLIVLTINVLFSAIGCWFFQALGNKLQWNAKSMLLLVLCSQISMIAYMSLGLFQPHIGLWNKWEIYLFGIAYGLLNGAWQSYSRVIWADMTLPGHEAEFFSLFEITDRGSSWLTPFIVGILESATGNLRWAFIWVFVVTAVPALAIKFGVDYEQGKIDVGRATASDSKRAVYTSQKDSNSHEHIDAMKTMHEIQGVEPSFPSGE